MSYIIDGNLIIFIDNNFYNIMYYVFVAFCKQNFSKLEIIKIIYAQY